MNGRSNENFQVKIGIIGYLGYATKSPRLGGQLTKTRYIYNALIKKCGKENVIYIDTSNWKKEKIKLLYECYKLAKKCKKIVVIPNTNGIKIIIPLFAIFKNIFGYKIAYPVVGGWLIDILKKYWILRKTIKKVDYILPEINSMKKELENLTESKIEVMPVFSTRKPIISVKIYERGKIFRFCTFSRVIPDKGIDLAIKAVSLANKELNDKECLIDIWGPIESDYEIYYKKLFKKYEICATYKGVLSGENCLNILSEYYMMLFPTYYYGEGFPAIICESFMAGLPVIASDWRYNAEIITQNETGILVPVKNVDKLRGAIIYAVNNYGIIQNMRENVWEKSKEYTPKKVMCNFMKWVEMK